MNQHGSFAHKAARRFLIAAGICAIASGISSTSVLAATVGEVTPQKSEVQSGSVSLETLLEESDGTKTEASDTGPMSGSAGSTDPLADQPAATSAPETKTPTATVAVAKPAVTPNATPVNKALPPMAQVKLLYKDGKFKDAQNILASMKPTELTHYYQGLCYQGQGQLKQAAYEFNYVASYAKDPMVKYNATVALRAVNSYASARTYSGQGNNFARVAAGGGSRPMRRG